MFGKNGLMRGICNKSLLFDCQLVSDEPKGNKMRTEFKQPWYEMKTDLAWCQHLLVPYERARVMEANLAYRE